MADVDDDKSSRESAEVSTTRWPLRLARAGQITKSEPQTTCYRPARDSGHGASSDAAPQRVRGRSSGAAVCGGTTATTNPIKKIRRRKQSREPPDLVWEAIDLIML